MATIAHTTIWVLLAVLLTACSPADDDPATDAGPIADCGPNLKAYKTACVPMLDDCPEDHAPVPGGGCKRVGVEPCDFDGIPGLKAAPDWTCKPIGVVECGNGDGIKGPPDWTCKPIGPPKRCLAGWALTKDGWCEPIVPKEPCPAGLMEVIGKTTCQPVGDCGSGTWGTIKTGPDTVYVDQSYKSADADGSESKPYPTIGQALVAAVAGGQIAVAAGLYRENLTIDKKVSLEGRCPAKVALVGKRRVTIAITPNADGVYLKGLTVTGSFHGIEVTGPNALIEAVVVSETGAVGVSVVDNGTLTLRDSLVDRSRTFGVVAISAVAAIERSSIRGTLFHFSANGIGAADWLGASAKVTIKDSVVGGNQAAGISGLGSSVTVERSLVANNQVTPIEGFAPGISINVTTRAPSLVLRDTVVAGNRDAGVFVKGGQASLERSVIRDTGPQAFGQFQGHGVGLLAYPSLHGPAKVVAKRSAFVRNHAAGVSSNGSNVTLERSVVRDNLPATPEVGCWGGSGIYAYGKATIATHDVLVAENTGYGVMVHEGPHLVMQRSIIRHNAGDKQCGWGGWGWGIFASNGKVGLHDSLVRNNEQVGVGIHKGTTLDVKRTVVQNTLPRASWGVGIATVMMSNDPDDPPASFWCGVSIGTTLSRGNHTGVLGTLADITITNTAVVETLHSKQVLEPFGVSMVGRSSRLAKLTMTGSLVADGQGGGLFATATDVSITDSVIRDQAEASSQDGPIGWGIGFAAKNPVAQWGDAAGELVLRDTLLLRIAGHALNLEAAKKTAAERIVVRGGKGIHVEGNSSPPAFTLEDSVLDKSESNALTLLGVNADVSRILVEDASNDGIFVGNSTTRLQDSRISGSKRSGLVASGGSGQLLRTVLRKGVFSVYLQEGAALDLLDHVFEDNVESRLTFDTPLAPPPAPKLPPPPKPPEGQLPW